MDGDVFGPYSAKGMMELDILPDLLVTENSIDTWKLASEFDFVALAKEEMLERLKNTAPKNEPSPETIIMEKRAALKKRLSNANSNMHKLVEVQECISKDSLFPSQIEFNANFNEGINSIGGKIIITPTQLIFHAHKLNFGTGFLRFETSADMKKESYPLCIFSSSMGIKSSSLYGIRPKS